MHPDRKNALNALPYRASLSTLTLVFQELHTPASSSDIQTPLHLMMASLLKTAVKKVWPAVAHPLAKVQGSCNVFPPRSVSRLI